MYVYAHNIQYVRKFIECFVAVPVKRSSRMVREIYPEIEPDKEGNLAEGLYNYKCYVSTKNGKKVREKLCCSFIVKV